MLSQFEFHDSGIGAIEYKNQRLRILSYNVEDFRSLEERAEGARYLSSLETIFEGVRDILVDNLACETIEMESPDGEMYSLDLVDTNQVKMFIYLHWYQPHRTVPRSIEFRFNVIRVNVISTVEEFDEDASAT